MSRAELKEHGEALSLRGRELDASEEEVKSLRRRAEEESEELERARQACVDMEQELRGRAEEADEREVGTSQVFMFRSSFRRWTENGLWALSPCSSLMDLLACACSLSVAESRPHFLSVWLI